MPHGRGGRWCIQAFPDEGGREGGREGGGGGGGENYAHVQSVRGGKRFKYNIKASAL